MFTDENMAVAKRAALRAEHRFRHNMAALNARRTADGVAVTTAHVGLHVGEVFYGNIGRTTPSANSASCEIVAASQTPIAAVIICQKPTSAEAAPAFSPNGDSACAVPNGLTMPIPSRNTPIAPRNGRKPGLYSATSSI